MVAKIEFDPLPLGHNRSDAAYFYQVAQNVAEGAGLRTSVSLYHAGLRELPTPTPFYPLWPLLLGGVGRWIGLERAASLLPELLYVVDVALLVALANAVGRALGGEVLVRLRGRPLLDLGTAVSVLLGTQAVFFAYTSVPWSDGMALGLLFGALLAMAPVARRPAAGWAALSGTLAGLSFLTRPQLALVPVTIVAALLTVGLRERRFLRAAGWAAAGSAVVVAPWLAAVSSLPAPVPLRALLDFTAYRETAELPPFLGFVAADGMLARLTDIGRGLLRAFHPTASESYAEAFGPAAQLVPIAIAVRLWELVRSRRRGVALRAPGPEALPALAAAFAAAGALAPVHALHARFPYEWFFHWHHALPFVLAITVAGAFLGARGPLWRMAIALAVAANIAAPRQTPARFARGWDQPPWPAERELAAWLDEQPRPPVLLSSQMRELAGWSRATGHWTWCELPAADTRLQLQYLPIDYVVVYPGERNCPFVRGLEPEFELVRRFGSKRRTIDVIRWRGAPSVRTVGPG